MASQTKRIGIVGNRGHLIIALSDIKTAPDCEIVGVCGAGPDIPVESVSETCTRALGATPPAFADDLPAMLDATRPDVLVVCGPFEAHAAMSAEALSRGIHVFCEKPFATTLDDLDTLVRARHHQPSAHIAQMCGPHYDPGMWSATQQLDQIGPVCLLSAQKSYKLGRREAFFTRRATSSGLIPWVGIHAISWLYHFAGRRPFAAVSAAHSTFGNRGHNDLEASSACLFTFADNLAATLTADYLRPENPAISHGDDRVRIMGTDGAIEVVNGTCHLTNATRTESAADTPPVGMFTDFLRLIDGQPSNILADNDAFRVTQAALLAREAADAGARLTVSGLLDH